MPDSSDGSSNSPRDWFNAYDGVRTMVLGASGFVGRWVARLLSRTGADLLLGVQDHQRATEIFQQFDVKGRIVALDLNDLTATADQVSKFQPAITFNLSGYGVIPSESDEVIADRINRQLLEIVCERIAAVTTPTWAGQNLVHAGTAFEYGAIGGNLYEGSTPNPAAVYGISKLAGSRALMQCSKSLGIRAITARLFTAYGPGDEHSGRLLPSLLRATDGDEPLPLTAGTQKRDFVYVEDVAEGFLRLGTAVAEPGDIVNLATGHLHTVRSFVECAAAIAGFPESRLRFGIVPLRREEMMQEQDVAVGRLEQLLGWLPRTTVEDGLRMTVEFLRSHRLATNP